MPAVEGRETITVEVIGAAQFAVSELSGLLAIFLIGGFMDEKKSCGSCKNNAEGGCSLDAEKVCLKSHGWDQNGPYNYAYWEAKENDIP